MNISCYTIGKTKEPEFIKFIQLYVQKITHYNNFEYHELPPVKNAGKLDVHQLKIEEGKYILDKIHPQSFLILLDEKGKEFSSPEFAQYISKKLQTGSKDLVFLIGGAFGFSEAVYQRANDKIALSQMTFTHQMVRLVFTEQLYRAFSILKGEKYHH